MRVKLLTTADHLATMEHNAAYAMLRCHANTERLEHEPARTFIEKAIKMKHDSILEHITLTYEVNDLSRACLQELARHRHISLSVESTRHTLKQQLKSDEIIISLPDGIDKELQLIICDYLQSLINYVRSNPNVQNDVLKYAIPECVCTNLVLTANVHELHHIVKLRTAPAALKEFQQLAHEFVNSLPDNFKYLLGPCVYDKLELEKMKL